MDVARGKWPPKFPKLSMPCLSFTPTSCLLRSPASVLVMLYSSLFLPFSVAFSAAVAFPSIQFRLSSLALCFTSLFFALYSCLLLCFKRSDLALSILSFASFLSLIFSHVCPLSMACSYCVLLLDLLYPLGLQTCFSPQCCISS